MLMYGFTFNPTLTGLLLAPANLKAKLRMASADSPLNSWKRSVVMGIETTLLELAGTLMPLDFKSCLAWYSSPEQASDISSTTNPMHRWYATWPL